MTTLLDRLVDQPRDLSRAPDMRHPTPSPPSRRVTARQRGAEVKPLPPLSPKVGSCQPWLAAVGAWTPCRIVALPVRAPAPRTVAAPLRLTRRAKLLCVALLGLCTVGVLGLSALHARTQPASLREAPATVVVQPGDTLWQIATEVAPADDPMRLIAKIRSANGLSTAPLRPGSTLVLPRG